MKTVRKTILTAAVLSVLSLQGARAAVEPVVHTFEAPFASLKDKSVILPRDGSWFPYPEYSDRAAWNVLSKDYRSKIVSEAKRHLDYQWYNMPASVYLEYEKTGDRSLYAPEEKNREVLRSLILAELVEGEGRFLPQIMDALWFYSQRYSWSHPQHTKYQKSGRTLPSPDDRPITFHSSAAGAMIALAYYFFHSEFDRIDPSLSVQVRKAVRDNILKPYLDPAQGGQSWMGIDDNPTRLNNHTTNQNMNSTLCFLLMEDNRDTLLEAVGKSLRIMDRYLSSIKPDGACEEGSAYWKASFGKVYQYCRMMYDFTSGRLDYLKEPLIRKMGEYKANAYMGDGFHMNYGDGASRDYVSPALLYRFGKDTGSRTLVDFSLFLMIEKKDKFDNSELINKYTDVYMSIETMRYGKRLVADQKTALTNAGNDLNVLRRLLSDFRSVWYPETEYAILRNASLVLAAKGADNGESHNHNDVGSFMLYSGGIPLFIDPGVGIYTADTFGGTERRYSVWTMQSDWHNLPKINGRSQLPGAEYASSGNVCDLRKNTFSTEIQGAYDPSAHCSLWRRTYSLGSSSLTLTEKYVLSERTAPDVFNFMVRAEVFLPGDNVGNRTVSPGEILIRSKAFSSEEVRTAVLSYPSGLVPSVEKKDCSGDSRLKRCWGDSISRISLTSASDAPVEGEYTFKITVL